MVEPTGAMTVAALLFRSLPGGPAAAVLSGGNPAISYFDNNNTSLKYAWASDALGTAWVSTTVDNSANVGGYTSLAVVSGNPAISYHDFSYDSLKYTRADNPNVVTLHATEAGPAVDVWAWAPVAGLFALALGGAAAIHARRQRRRA